MNQQSWTVQGTLGRRGGRRLGLGKKLGAAFLAFLLFLSGNFLLMGRYYRQMTELSQVVDLAGTLRYTSQQIAFEALLVTAGHQDHRVEVGDAIARFDANLDRLEQDIARVVDDRVADNPELARRLEALRGGWSGYRGAAQAVADGRAAHASLATAMAQITRDRSAVLAAADTMVAEVVRTTNRIHARVDRIILVSLACEFAALILFFAYVQFRLARPIARLADMASRFAAGEHGTRLDFRSGDEIGDLVASMNRGADLLEESMEEQNQLASDLVASRDFYLKLLQDFPTPVWRADCHGRCDYVNHTWQEFTGRGVEETLGDGWLASLHPDDRERCAAAFRRALPQRLPFSAECRLRRRDGSYRSVLNYGSPYFGIDGAFAGYIGSCYDVTDQRAAEHRLQLYGQAFANVREAVVITDARGDFVSVNRAFTEITGYSADEVQGRNPRLLQSGRQDAAFYREMWQALTGAGYWQGEIWNRRRDGGLYQQWLAISAVRDETGQVVNYVGIASDLTERRSVDERLRLWGQALESSINPILITDALAPDAPLVYVNPAFERLTGYGRNEVLGRNCRFLQGDDTGQPALEEIRRAMREQREGRALLRNFRKDGTPYWNELLVAPVRNEADDVTHFIGIQNDVTERIRYQEQLEYQANHDALTGLPNRNLLADRAVQAIAHARRRDQVVAVLFLDLDAFKRVNDSLGHAAGDSLLQEVADRLRAALREGDTAARQGGDEFVLVVTDVGREDDVSRVARKVLDALSPPFALSGKEVFVTCSMGIALFPRDGDDAATLLRNADLAMYRAKELGRSNFQYYAAEMNTRAMEHLLLEGQLRRAIERDELVLHYQPRANLSSGAVTGMEALVRWQHPDLGLVPPARFVPLAEETGLIVPLGEWVLRRACTQAKAWQDMDLPPLRVAVNVSARQLRHAEFPRLVDAVLRETGLAPTCLELEITESVLMQDVDTTAATLQALKAGGVHIAIDDFGTGYSSLGYLKRLPIHILKIDQSFVRDIVSDPDDAIIARTIISLAHEMGLEVIAEGVETEEQMCLLRQRRCDEMQGYFFSRPLTSEAITRLLVEDRRLPPAASPAGGERVLLLLDDEQNIISALTRILRREGYRILAATTADAAFELLARNRVGVVLADQRMPTMSGVEFLRRVKQMYPDTVRIVLSGYTDLQSVTDAINEGAIYKFLTKPWDDGQLRDQLREAFFHQEAVSVRATA